MSNQDLELQLTLIKGTLDARFTTTGQTIQCLQDLCQNIHSSKRSDLPVSNNESKTISDILNYTQSLLLKNNDDNL